MVVPKPQEVGVGMAVHDIVQWAMLCDFCEQNSVGNNRHILYKVLGK